MKFDGNYFQILMIQFMQCNDKERHERMKPIKTGVMLNDESEFNLF